MMKLKTTGPQVSQIDDDVYTNAGTEMTQSTALMITDDDRCTKLDDHCHGTKPIHFSAVPHLLIGF